MLFSFNVSTPSSYFIYFLSFFAFFLTLIHVLSLYFTFFLAVFSLLEKTLYFIFSVNVVFRFLLGLNTFTCTFWSCLDFLTTDRKEDGCIVSFMSFFSLALLIYTCICANSTDFNIISAAKFNETVANGNWLFVAFLRHSRFRSIVTFSIVCYFTSLFASTSDF